MSVITPLELNTTDPPEIITPVPVGFVIVPPFTVNVPAQLVRSIPLTPPVEVMLPKTALIDAPLPFEASKPPPVVLVMATSFTSRFPIEFVPLLSIPKSEQLPTSNPRKLLFIAKVTPSPEALVMMGLVPLIFGSVLLLGAKVNGSTPDKLAAPVCPSPYSRSLSCKTIPPV